jgi:hypothetical protein
MQQKANLNEIIQSKINQISSQYMSVILSRIFLKLIYFASSLEVKLFCRKLAMDGKKVGV